MKMSKKRQEIEAKWLIAHVHRLQTEEGYIDSLDREITSHGDTLEGMPVTLHDVTFTSDESKKIRILASIKADVMPLLKNENERKLINLMLKGYTQSEASKLMNLSRQRIAQIFDSIKNRVKKRYKQK